MTTLDAIPTAPKRQPGARKARQAREREMQRAAKRAVLVASAARKEAADEEIAPAAQRHAVITADGEIYRVPRVERSGLTFKRSNPVHHLRARGTCTKAHERAADRLAQVWEDGGRGVGRGAALYGERTSGTPQSGWISDHVLAQIGYQNRCRAEFAGAHTWLGALFGVLQAVVLDGIDVTAWAQIETERRQREAILLGHDVPLPMDRNRGVGYLLAALDRLVEFYAALDRAKRGPERGPAGIVSVVIGAREPEMAGTR